MRKTKVRQLLEVAKSDPQGMSKKSYRAVKSNYANGLNRLDEPTEKRSRRQVRLGKRRPGFPKGVIIKWGKGVVMKVTALGKKKYTKKILFRCFFPR